MPHFHLNVNVLLFLMFVKLFGDDTSTLTLAIEHMLVGTIWIASMFSILLWGLLPSFVMLYDARFYVRREKIVFEEKVRISSYK